MEIRKAEAPYEGPCECKCGCTNPADPNNLDHLCRDCKENRHAWKKGKEPIHTEFQRLREGAA